MKSAKKSVNHFSQNHKMQKPFINSFNNSTFGRLQFCLLQQRANAWNVSFVISSQWKFETYQLVLIPNVSVLLPLTSSFTITSGKKYKQQRSWSVPQTVLLKEAKTVTQTPPPPQKRKQHKCKMDISRFVSKLKVISGLSWLVLYSALRGFSSRNPLSLLTKNHIKFVIWYDLIQS